MEHLTSSAENALRKCFGEEMLAGPEVIRRLRVFPAVGDKVLSDIAQALAEAGYESFGLKEIKAAVHQNKRISSKLSQ